MYVEMVCNCTASFSIDSDGENNDALWVLVWRFGAAHIKCGFMTSGEASGLEQELFNDSSIKPKRNTKKKEEE